MQAGTVEQKTESFSVSELGASLSIAGMEGSDRFHELLWARG